MHILVISRSTGRSRRRVASLMDSYAVRTGEVGRGGEFEPTGATPVAWTRRKHKLVVPVWVRRLALLAAASGVSHDIGKASCGFQRKLHSTDPVRDAVRHEWLSMQVRRRLRAGMEWRTAWDLGGREGTAMTTVPELSPVPWRPWIS